MLRAKSDRDNAVAAALAAAEQSLRRLRVAADGDARLATRLAEEAASALSELHRARLEQAALAERIQADLDTTILAVQDLGGAEAEAALAVQRETTALLSRVSRAGVVPLVEVRGFRVHAEIGPALEGLLAEAERDGIVLGGWGHRTTQQQISLRRQHCGGDADAVYDAPSSSCSPPTAKPGTSMHELGLAVDFTYEGASISTRSSPAFRWLAEHAPSYGFHNLPSEPWHWSVSGD
ncbi:MAG: M15 family metallopeptidase [Acidimicrobiales bacterium]|nr:M15 family metallopeptidase [Acidimicrobiales bacterium]